MKNKKFKLLILGSSTVVAAGACYALISPSKQIEIQPTATKHGNPPQLQLKIDEPIISSPEINYQPDSLQIDDQPLNEIVHTIKKGESLSTIFSAFNFSKTDLHKIINANSTGKLFNSIVPGKELVVQTSQQGQLEKLLYQTNTIDTLIATRNDDDSFSVKKVSKLIEKQLNSVHAVIHSSLYLDGKSAGLSDKLIMQMANIFAWDIDFALNLREGDQFTVVYENLLIDGKEFDTGDIIAAEFIYRDHTYTAVRYEDDNGKADYYTPEGKSMRKAFLRTPVDFTRISSYFNLKRKHPILNRIRAHKGVDYAAKTGTPVKSTGDGKIIFRGRKGGYGNVVIVQHGRKYTTLYAHLSKFKKGQKIGSSVRQGQVIGFVGQTGLASGPHLHYEFRVNGIHRNPLTVKLPQSNPIKKSLLAKFKTQTAQLLAQLDRAKANSLLAQNQ